MGFPRRSFEGRRPSSGAGRLPPGSWASWTGWGLTSNTATLLWLCCPVESPMENPSTRSSSQSWANENSILAQAMRSDIKRFQPDASIGPSSVCHFSKRACVTGSRRSRRSGMRAEFFNTTLHSSPRSAPPGRTLAPPEACSMAMWGESASHRVPRWGLRAFRPLVCAPCHRTRGVRALWSQRAATRLGQGGHQAFQIALNGIRYSSSRLFMAARARESQKCSSAFVEL